MKKVIKAMMFAALLSVCVLWTSNNAWADTVTVTESSVYIRSSASTTGKILGGAMQNEVLETLGTETDDAGKIWYKVKMNDGTIGYVREDLVSTKGATTTQEPKEEPKTEEPAATEAPAATSGTEVTEVEPAAATVTGGVNVRKGPSTSTDLIAQAAANTAVTVTGYVNTGSELWYQLTYSDNSNDVNGFIRSDFIKLSGELTEKKAEEPEPEVVEEPEAEPEEPEEEKVYQDYGVSYEKDEEGKITWYLNSYNDASKYEITTLLNTKEEYAKDVAELQKKNRNKIIAILLILIVDALLIGAAVYLYLRWREGDFDDTEETVRVSKPKAVQTKTSQASKSTATHSISSKQTEKKPAATSVRTSTGVSGAARTQSTANPATGKTPAVRSISASTIPEGSVSLGEGRYRTPDGTIVKTVSVKGRRLPDGSIVLADGRIRKPDGTMVAANSTTTANRPVSHSTDDDMELGFLNGSSSDK